MGTKASIHVIEVSVKRMPANADLFLDLMSHSPPSLMGRQENVILIHQNSIFAVFQQPLGFTRIQLNSNGFIF